MLRRHRRRRPEVPVIQLAPVVDTALNLLIFFMLITHFGQPVLNVSLPESSTATPNEERSVTLSLTADGMLSLDGEMLGWDDITPRLRQTADEIKLVRIHADEAVSYREIVRAFDAVRAADLVDIALETDMPRGPAGGGVQSSSVPADAGLPPDANL